MKVTALPGKVMTAAAVVAFLIAAAVKATFWPFAVFVPAGVSGLAGWAIYRQDGNGHDDGMDAGHAQSRSASSRARDRRSPSAPRLVSQGRSPGSRTWPSASPRGQRSPYLLASARAGA